MAQYCTFYLGPQIYGLDILGIQEILRFNEITPVPNGPFYVEGLINLRGQIVVAVNLRRLFGISAPPAGIDPIHLIVNFEGEALSLMADRAGDVIDFGGEEMLTPPAHKTGSASRLIQGVFRLKDALLQVLDVRAIFETQNGPESIHLNPAES
ncbi:MAG: chemotaxis protein CheW [Fibrobacteria bacterium]